MSFQCDDMIYELREVIVGNRGDFYFDAETEDYEDCEVCYATVDKGTLNDVQAGRICNECHRMNQYTGGTRTIKTPYNAETDSCNEAKEEVKKLRRKIALLDKLYDKENALHHEILGSGGFFKEHELKGLFSEKDLKNYEYWS